jgi:hypothetical protein
VACCWDRDGLTKKRAAATKRSGSLQAQANRFVALVVIVVFLRMRKSGALRVFSLAGHA